MSSDEVLGCTPVCGFLAGGGVGVRVPLRPLGGTGGVADLPGGEGGTIEARKRGRLTWVPVESFWGPAPPPLVDKVAGSARVDSDVPSVEL